MTSSGAPDLERLPNRDAAAASGWQRGVAGGLAFLRRRLTGEYTVEPWSIVVLQARPTEPDAEPHVLWGRRGGVQVGRTGRPYLRGLVDRYLPRLRRDPAPTSLDATTQEAR